MEKDGKIDLFSASDGFPWVTDNTSIDTVVPVVLLTSTGITVVYTTSRSRE